MLQKMDNIKEDCAKENNFQRKYEVNDDDMNSPASSNQPEKRFKMDYENYQGQDIKTLPSSESISDNVDSGICAEKSESTLSDEPFFTNSETDSKCAAIHISPSTSNVSFNGNSSSHIRNRNYRRRNISTTLSTDSDDYPSDKDEVENRDKKALGNNDMEENVESRPIVSQNPLSISVCSENTKSEFAYGSDSDSDGDSNNNSSSSPAITDSDDWTDMETSTRNDDNSDYETPIVLLKKKPDHNWFLIKELMLREIGIGFGPGKSGRNNSQFERGFYGSLQAVQKLELMYKLDKHQGCVNSISFHPEGQLLASGSDDLNVIIWDWATNTPRHVVKSGHKNNVFQSKFLYLNAGNQLNVVSCGRDGQVRLMQIPPSGGNRAKRGVKSTVSAGGILRQKLAQHSGPAHKLHVSPAEPHIITSAGEDGVVYLSDVRLNKANLLLTVRERGKMIPLYSIHGHPLDPKEFVVSGNDKFVRVYDRRKAGPLAKPLHLYCPSFFHETSETSLKRKALNIKLYITCAIYNHTGSEILATYKDDDIYLFDAVTDRYNKESPNADGFSHRYSGHRNSATFKNVSFFGPQSEFVVTGSDCGNIYIWDKKTEAIVQWMMGDEDGVVNCIECHPRFPVLATSGLDKDVKIWVPSNEQEPTLNGLREAVQDNHRAHMRTPLISEFLESSVPLYTFLGRELLWSRRPPSSDGEDNAVGSDEDDAHQYGGNVCTAF